MKKRSHTKEIPAKETRRSEAWIYTVINPLIEGLRVERTFLKEKNWTWRYHTKSLEFILPLERYIDSVYLPNFEDFFLSNRKFERLRTEHDTLRVALSEHCQNAADHIVESPDFQQKVATALSTYEKQYPGDYPGGAVPKQDFPRLITQYVVNQTRELPSHYTTSKFWNEYGQGFLQLQTEPVFEELNTSGRKLEDLDEQLLAALEKLRSGLSRKYDIPPAPMSLSAHPR